MTVLIGVPAAHMTDPIKMCTGHTVRIGHGHCIRMACCSVFTYSTAWRGRHARCSWRVRRQEGGWGRHDAQHQLGGVNHRHSHYRLVKITWFDVRGEKQRCDWVENSHGPQVYTGPTQKRRFSTQSQRCISPCTLNPAPCTLHPTRGACTRRWWATPRARARTWWWWARAALAVSTAPCCPWQGDVATVFGIQCFQCDGSLATRYVYL